MSFAEPKDVATRLGRDLTSAEESAAWQVIEMVTGLIVDVVERDDAWAEKLDPVPVVLKGLCVEKALAAIANPSSVASESETLGAHTHSQTFRRPADGGGVYLTEQEERMAARAVYGSTSGSSSVESMVDRVIDLRENRDVDEDPQ